MKNDTRSTLGSRRSIERRNRSSHDGRPDRCSTRTRSRITFSANDCSLLLVSASPAEHRRRDAEDEVARVIGQPVERDLLFRAIAAQHDAAGGDRPAVALQRDLDLPVGQARLADDRLDAGGRAHERELVGQHGRDRQIAQRLLAQADGVDRRAQRLDRRARGRRRAALRRCARCRCRRRSRPPRPDRGPRSARATSPSASPMRVASAAGGSRSERRASRARRSRRSCRGRPRGRPAASAASRGAARSSSAAARSARDGPPSGGRTSIEREASTSTATRLGSARDLAQLDRRLQRGHQAGEHAERRAGRAARRRGRAAPRPATASTARSPARRRRTAARRPAGRRARSRPARGASRCNRRGRLEAATLTAGSRRVRRM